jgi:hypothetical protein
MIQAVPPPIIRSTKLYIQSQVLSKPILMPAAIVDDMRLSIYFYKLLYMFQAVSPPIIRSTKLYIQRQVLSNQYLLASSISSTITAGSNIGLTIPDVVYTVLCS